MISDDVTDSEARPLLSVVVPALNEADNVPGLLERFANMVERHAPRYRLELVVVDDGSQDGTADAVLGGSPPDGSVTVIRLSRCFGAHYAISAGLAGCNGDAAVVLGADLQEPPSLIDEFLSAWEAGSDVVWGVRRSRVGRSAAQELVSRAFSTLFTRYADLENYPPEGPSGVLVVRSVINEVAKLSERNRNVLALIAWLGFTQTRVLYDQLPRAHGKSRWSRRKMLQLATDSLLQFSSMPLRFCSLAGLTVAAAGIFYAIFLVIRSLASVPTPSGWPTVLVVMLLLGGTQLTVIGVMGEYLWRAVEETRRRPLYVVRDVRVTGPGPGLHTTPPSTIDGRI